MADVVGDNCVRPAGYREFKKKFVARVREKMAEAGNEYQSRDLRSKKPE